ncbi:MAG: DUF2628 domain-containing protein [Alphaproteobacteria bacterium]|nr:MAG: DUF2628 domain-containing protein [Alphaproteobacteria bacterium]
MAYYTVHQAPDLKAPAQLDAPRGERPIFIREGFSPFAFFVPILWPLFYGQILSFLALLLGNALILALGLLLHLPIYALIGIFIAGNLLVAFEAGNWRRRLIDRKGWPVVNMLEAPSAREARRMYEDVLIINGEKGQTPPPVDISEPGADSPASALPVKEKAAEKAAEKAQDKAAKKDEEKAEEKPVAAPAPRPKAASPLKIPKPPRDALDAIGLLQLRDQPRIRDRGAVGPPKLAKQGSPQQENLTAPRPDAKETPRRRSRRR